MLWLLPKPFAATCLKTGLKNPIKVGRARNDLSQTALAEKVKAARHTIHAIEKRRFVPSTALALKISFVPKIKVGDPFELEGSDWDWAHSDQLNVTRKHVHLYVFP